MSLPLPAIEPAYIAGDRVPQKEEDAFPGGNIPECEGVPVQVDRISLVDAERLQRMFYGSPTGFPNVDEMHDFPASHFMSYLLRFFNEGR